jgi:hypothetical protein
VGRAALYTLDFIYVTLFFVGPSIFQWQPIISVGENPKVMAFILER